VTPLRLIVIVLLLCINATSTAERYGMRTFQTVGDDSDIPLGVVTALFQDNKGFIWIGTQRGLIKYDGYRFKKYQHDKNDHNSIAGNFVSVIKQDEKGRLWVGTGSNGLSIFEPDHNRFQHYKHSKTNDNSLSHNQIRDIAFDKDGNAWIATAGGLDLVTSEQHAISRFKHQGINPLVNTILIDAQNILWAGTKESVQFFDIDKRLFTSSIQTTSKYAVTALFAYKDEVWLGTKEHGILIFDSKTKKPVASPNKISLSHPWVSSMLATANDEIWVATFGAGIDIVDAERKQVIEHIKRDPSIDSSINLDSVSSLLKDNTDMLWIGTWGKGLNKYNAHHQAFSVLRHSPTQPRGLSHPDIYSILELKDGRWLVGNGAGTLDILDNNFNRISTFKKDIINDVELPSGLVTSLYQSFDNTVWIGTNNHGLFSLDLENMTLTSYDHIAGLLDPSIYKILPDKGNLWVATHTGLNYFDRELNQFSHFYTQNGDIFSKRVNTLVKANNGHLWLATSDGLYVLPKGESEVIQFIQEENNPNSISDNYILGLLEDSSGQLWIDTSNGLNRLISYQNGQAKFENVSKQFAKPNFYFGGNMQESSKGDIWTQWAVLSTDNLTITEISKSEGADAGTVWLNAFTRSKDGLLVYGGTEGLLIINPDKYIPRAAPSQTQVTAIEIDGKYHPITKHVVLPPTSSGFSVEFSSLDYFQPNLNLYGHKLIGYDKDWMVTDASNRRVTYTNLDPGLYQLQLKVSDHNGIWTEDQQILTVNIQPKFYQTNIFRFLLLATIVLLLYALYIVRIKQLKNRHLYLRNEVKSRTKELKTTNIRLKMQNEIGKEITATQNLDSVLNKIYEYTHQMMATDIFSIGIFKKEEGIVDIAFSIEFGNQMASYHRSIDDKNQLIVWCINNNQHILIKDAATQIPNYIDENQWQQVMSEHHIGSFSKMQSHLYVPLTLRTEAVGAIAVHSVDKHAFDETKLEVLSALATYAAIAIDNANKMQKLNWANQTLKTAQKALELSCQKLEETSITDQLTGLKNRHFLVSNIEADVSKSLREYKTFASQYPSVMPHNMDMVFFLIDIDHFKQVNDLYGHSAGDSVLISIKLILEEIFRTSDYLVRWGGEEFLVVARYTDRGNAPILAERVREKIERFDFRVRDNIPLNLTVSLGFACFPFVQKFEPELTWEQVIETADVCLYAAKRSARNAWVGVYGLQDLDCKAFMKELDRDPSTLLSQPNMKLVSSLSDLTKIKWR